MIDTFETKLYLSSRVDIKLYDQHGKIIDERLVTNVVTNGGKGIMASRGFDFASGAVGRPIYMQIGTGTAPPSATDTAITPALNQLNAPTRVGTTTGPLKTLDGTPTTYDALDYNRITWTGVFGTGNGTGIITEAGLFNGLSGGTLFARTTFTGLNKTSTSTLQIVWVLQLNN